MFGCCTVFIFCLIQLQAHSLPNIFVSWHHIATQVEMTLDWEQTRYMFNNSYDLICSTIFTQRHKFCAVHRFSVMDVCKNCSIGHCSSIITSHASKVKNCCSPCIKTPTFQKLRSLVCNDYVTLLHMTQSSKDWPSFIDPFAPVRYGGPKYLEFPPGAGTWGGV